MRRQRWLGFVLGFYLLAGACATEDEGVEPAVAAEALLSADADGDGYPAGVDCNDHNPDIHPGAQEYCHDGVDSNCANGDAEVAPNCIIRPGPCPNCIGY